jgi:hypothetical protein
MRRVDRIPRRRREAGSIGQIVDRVPERQPDQPPGGLFRGFLTLELGDEIDDRTTDPGRGAEGPRMPSLPRG